MRASGHTARTLLGSPSVRPDAGSSFTEAVRPRTLARQGTSFTNRLTGRTATMKEIHRVSRPNL